MALKDYSHRILYGFSCIAVLGIFLAANRVRIPYTPYQILVWELKANEGYRSWWYPDGVVRGKQAYSIGFGWNDQGRRRRHEIKQYTRDRKVTFQEATEITLYEIKKYGKMHSDPYKNLALQMYSYNCGPANAIQRLGGCCGFKRGCGNDDSKIRPLHNRRRKFELALWRHDLPAIMKYTEENKNRLHKDIKFLKRRGVNVK